jgi:hypothetical protein
MLRFPERQRHLLARGVRTKTATFRRRGPWASWPVPLEQPRRPRILRAEERPRLPAGKSLLVSRLKDLLRTTESTLELMRQAQRRSELARKATWGPSLTFDLAQSTLVLPGTLLSAPGPRVQSAQMSVESVRALLEASVLVSVSRARPTPDACEASAKSSLVWEPTLESGGSSRSDSSLTFPKWQRRARIWCAAPLPEHVRLPPL